MGSVSYAMNESVRGLGLAQFRQGQVTLEVTQAANMSLSVVRDAGHILDFSEAYSSVNVGQRNMAHFGFYPREEAGHAPDISTHLVLPHLLFGRCVVN